MSEATTETNPLRGHLVGFPKAIPSRGWLAQRMLWADQLGAVWPLDEPMPRSDEEERAMEDARTYKDAGFFTPCSVPWNASPAVLKQLGASLRLSDSKAKRWMRALATSAFDQWNPDSQAHEPVAANQFFYLEKFPREVQQALLSSGVATREGPHGLTIRTLKQAETLMTALAEHAEPWKELDLARTLETKDVAALARAATPTSASDSRPAVMLDIPLVVGDGTDEVTAEALIKFRQKPGTEQARQDYLDAVGRYVVKQTERDSSRSAVSVARDKVAHDVQLASTSWGKRAIEAGVGAVVLATVSAVVPLPNPESTGDWVGATAGAAGVGVGIFTAVRRSHVHGYLNSARRARVLG